MGSVPQLEYCSAHFSKEDFTQMFSGPFAKVPWWLATNKISVVTVSEYNVVSESPLSARAKKMIVEEALSVSVSAQGEEPHESHDEPEPENFEDSMPMEDLEKQLQNNASSMKVRKQVIRC